MMTIDATKDLGAIGRLAARLGVSVDDVLAAVERLGLKPAMRVDRVVFFDRDQVDLLTRELRKGTP